MITIEIPRKFQPALCESAFIIKNLPRDQVLDVDVYNNKNDMMLVTKRFRGGEDIRVNVAPYAKRIIQIKPEESNVSQIRDCSERVAAIRVDTKYATSEESYFSLAVQRAELCKSLSNGPEKRTISWSDSDEIAMFVEEKNVKAKVILIGTQSQLEVDLGSAFVLNGMCLVSIVMKDIASRLESSVGGKCSDFKQMKAVVEIAGNQPIVRNYDIVNEQSSGVRMCWVNKLGALDFYTMVQEVHTEASVDKKNSNVIQGLSFSGANIEIYSTLVSSNEPKATMEWVSEVLSAPAVWIIKNNRFTQVDVLTNNVAIYDKEKLSRLEIVVKPYLT